MIRIMYTQMDPINRFFTFHTNLILFSINLVKGAENQSITNFSNFLLQNKTKINKYNKTIFALHYVGSSHKLSIKYI